MLHHELETASLMLAAAVSVTTLIVNADAKDVSGRAPESIQSYNEDHAARNSPRLHPATSTAAGSVTDALPPSCVLTGRLGTTYYNCTGVWYEPRFAGEDIRYVVVNPPPQIAASLLRVDLTPRTRRDR